MDRLVSSLLALVLATASARAEKFHSAEFGFSLEIPEGWQPMSDEQIRALNTLADAVMKENECRSIAGFHQRGKAFNDVPYVIVQHVAIPVRSFGDFVREAQHMQRSPREVTQGKLPGFISKFDANNLAVDHARHRLTLRMQMSAMGIFNLEMYSLLAPCRVGSLTIHGYDFAANMSKSIPTFRTIHDSFQFDPGFEFVDESLAMNLLRNPVIAPAIIGSLVALVLSLIYRLFKKIASGHGPTEPQP